MTNKVLTIIAAFGLLGLHCSSGQKEETTATDSSKAKPFATALVYFEQNATDGDVEVVFKAKAGENGMTKLMVVGPDGRTVIDFKAPDVSTMGIRQFQMESPEPEDIEAVKKAYPAGVYKFTGTTTDGKEFMSSATLSHTLPPEAKLLHPQSEAENISAEDFEISWSPVDGVEKFLIEVEQEELDLKIEAQLPGTETSFAVPQKFLHADMGYKIVLGTMSETGNLNFIETEFSTAGEEEEED